MPTNETCAIGPMRSRNCIHSVTDQLVSPDKLSALGDVLSAVCSTMSEPQLC